MKIGTERLIGNPFNPQKVKQLLQRIFKGCLRRDWYARLTAEYHGSWIEGRRWGKETGRIF
jgi:hypothetical protein